MIPQKVQSVLDQHGLRALEFEDGATPTSTQAAARIGVEVGQIAKSILVKAKGDNYYLLVCPGDTRINNRKLKSTLGVRARMASVEETFAVTGFRPGGVCPFGLNGIEIFIDNGLSRYTTIYPAAGTDASGVAMSFQQLCQISGGTRGDFAD